MVVGAKPVVDIFIVGYSTHCNLCRYTDSNTISHAPSRLKRIVEIISIIIVCALLMGDLLFYMLTIPF